MLDKCRENKTNVEQENFITESFTDFKTEESEKKDEKASVTSKAKRKKEILYHSELENKSPDNVITFLKNNIYVIFIEPETPGNIGFLARTMANFGLKKLILINPCELKNESYYQAMHAKDIVRYHLNYPSLKDAVKELNLNFLVGTSGTPGGSYNLSRIPLTPEQLSKSIINNNKLIDGNIAIIFGREGDGLTNKEIEMCDILTSIPTDKNYPIMNISHSAAIIFYELFKNINEFDVEGLEEANRFEKDYLINDFNEIIESLNLPPHKSKNGLKTFKNIINRAFITGREAHTFKGILRRVKLKIQNKDDL